MAKSVITLVREMQDFARIQNWKFDTIPLK